MSTWRPPWGIRIHPRGVFDPPREFAFPVSLWQGSRRIGSIAFAAVFVSLGALSFLGSWLISPASTIPIIGNSGAVSFLLAPFVLDYSRDCRRAGRGCGFE